MHASDLCELGKVLFGVHVTVYQPVMVSFSVFCLSIGLSVSSLTVLVMERQGAKLLMKHGLLYHAIYQVTIGGTSARSLPCSTYLGFC